MSARILAFAALLVSLFITAGTAQAAPQVGGTALVLEVQHSDVADNAHRATVLTCGRTDEHPRGAQACAALAAARADLGAMAADDRACTFEHAPVEVSMFGFWRGAPVHQVRTFPNSCVMLAHTGALFDF
ncbi:SSI family serine proteinase inhibitor [Lentzea sp. NPDC042327]|uniref:SSI family serine proteinase inhibitor n=1 Tax=Lentzea sp. NPDC042327 TaxID=3154801 RepID=UPI0033CCE28C